jgi:hypothetical protein
LPGFQLQPIFKRLIYAKRAENVPTLTLGIGVFSQAARPRITFGNNQIQVSEDGTPRYKFTVSGKPGKYNIPTKINYVNQESIRMEEIWIIEYTIID